jgi:hypothetical protein
VSKRETIRNNLLALTHHRSFEKAVQGWLVTKVIALSGRQQQACELCGTRFQNGAVVRHEKSRARILVGGTCLEMLQAQRFADRVALKTATRFTTATLRSRYESLIDPSNWLQWIQENAPDRLAQAATDLRLFGVTLDARQLQELIRFHDRTRQFPREALLPGATLIERALGVRIPRYITISDADRLKGKTKAHPRLLCESAAAAYLKTDVRPFIEVDDDLAALWHRLDSMSQRAVTALVKLDERAALDDSPLLPDDKSGSWPRPGQPPMFVWNARIGLGFVAQDDVYDHPKAYVWLWRSDRYQRATYSLDYWRGVIGCTPEAVEQIEDLAFGS